MESVSSTARTLSAAATLAFASFGQRSQTRRPDGSSHSRSMGARRSSRTGSCSTSEIPGQPDAGQRFAPMDYSLRRFPWSTHSGKRRPIIQCGVRIRTTDRAIGYRVSHFTGGVLAKRAHVFAVIPFFAAHRLSNRGRAVVWAMSADSPPQAFLSLPAFTGPRPLAQP